MRQSKGLIAVTLGSLFWMMSNPLSATSHTHADPSKPTQAPMHDPSKHHHGGLEIPSGQAVPTVKLVVYPDAKQGWNLEVQVTNFSFAPDRVNTKSVPTEGHAHLYIDGKKITRLYGSWYYLASLPAGKHEVTVGLNANGHEALMHQGKPIAATTIITAD
jgi:uncharacterized Zn-binding protein involved in type VI secretion